MSPLLDRSSKAPEQGPEQVAGSVCLEQRGCIDPAHRLPVLMAILAGFLIRKHRRTTRTNGMIENG